MECAKTARCNYHAVEGVEFLTPNRPASLRACWLLDLESPLLHHRLADPYGGHAGIGNSGITKPGFSSKKVLTSSTVARRVIQVEHPETQKAPEIGAF
jgi:hypothetical protein